MLARGDGFGGKEGQEGGNGGRSELRFDGLKRVEEGEEHLWVKEGTRTDEHGTGDGVMEEGREDGFRRGLDDVHAHALDILAARRVHHGGIRTCDENVDDFHLGVELEGVTLEFALGRERVSGEE